jgi:CubicO group peptidase (beta-lactamase class C family)
MVTEVAMDVLVKKLREKALETSFSGVVSIFREKKQLYAEAFGYADIANIRENRIKTKFAIASGTKLFTALGIGALIDEGQLSLDAMISDIFHQDFTFVSSKATIAQFLTHSSGIWDYYNEDLDINPENFYVEIPWSQLQTPSDYLPLFEGKRPKYVPGETFSYSNGGFIFLGILIEKITGRLYRDYIREKVFLPAGMRESGYFAFNQLPGNAAYGYKTSGETNIYNLPVRGGSDGGAYTTVGDVNRLWKALFGKKILSKELTKIFLTPHITVGGPVQYGYGLYISKFNGGDMYFFVGGDAGVGFDSRYIPDMDLQITVISNFSDGEEKIRDVIYTNLGDVL